MKYAALELLHRLHTYLKWNSTYTYNTFAKSCNNFPQTIKSWQHWFCRYQTWDCYLQVENWCCFTFFLHCHVSSISYNLLSVKFTLYFIQFCLNCYWILEVTFFFHCYLLWRPQQHHQQESNVGTVTKILTVLYKIQLVPGSILANFKKQKFE